MSSDQFQQLYNQLPPAAQDLVANYAISLGKVYAEELAGNADTTASLPQPGEGFRGLWKDREDMQDSTAWVRELRKSQWPN